MADSVSVGSLHYDLDLDKSKFDDGSKAASSSMDKLKGKFAETGEASQAFTKAFLIGGAAVGAAAIGFAKSSVDAYNQSAQVLTQLEAVIKSTGNAAGLSVSDYTDQATALEHLTGVSDESVIAGQAMLATFTNIKGGVMQQATQATLDMATAMNSGAIPSQEQMAQQAMQLGKALNDPATGLTKLQKIGVTFTEDQKKQITAMQEAGDTAGAQTMILKELNKEFGGSSVAAGKTFTGQMNIAKETFGDFQEVVGGVIVKALVPLVGAINDWFASMGGPEGMMQALIDKFKEINKWIQEHKVLVIAIAGAIAAPLVVAFTMWAVAAAIAAFNTFLALAPLMLLGAAVAAVAYIVYTNWSNIITWTQNLVNTITTFFTDLWNTITTGWNNMVNAVVGFFTSLWQSLVSIAQSIWDTVYPILEAFWVAVTLPARLAYAAIYLLMYALHALFVYIWSLIGDTVIAAATWVWNQVVFIFNSIRDFFVMVWTAIYNFIAGIVNAIAGFIVNTFNAVKSPVIAAFTWIKDTAVGIWNSIAGFFTGAYNTIHDALMKPFDDAKTGITGTLSGISTAVSGWFSSLKGSIGSGLNVVIDGINKLINSYNGLPGTPDIPNVPRFQSGVRNFGGGWAMVGDVLGSNSGELIHLPQGSDVYSNSDSKGMLGGGGVNVTFTGDIMNTDDKTLDAIGRRIGQQVIQAQNGAL